MKNAFTPAKILLPKNNPETWAVIACDQFSSEREYWDRVSETVGDRPSTLHMVVPEAYLGSLSMEEASLSRNEKMAQYLKEEVFCTYENALIYVEREITGGKIRRGVIGKLDLEAYDYLPDTNPPARASEKTVVDRLPPRIKVRSGACLEMPHILVLIDDEKRGAIEPLTEKKECFEKVYDFDLMEDGGHIRGWRVSDTEALRVTEAMDALGQREVQFVIGDGNHSLAAAKDCWREIKKTLTPAEAQTHPARFALVEICNVYDDGIEFEPIHRIVFNCDPEAVLADLHSCAGDEKGRELETIANGKRGSIKIVNNSLGGLIGAVQKVLDRWEQEKGVTVDYIHDEKALEELSEQENSLAIFLPAMDKSDLFSTVEKDGVFPKKSFSIGHARDKRYYLECRKIK
ncbi:MAG: DUF1015 domain-containing protein [Ruminococcaceae bacterium]|nr:DUF1015 domain-containing protein [Oscillospiraceae bacterium]